MAIDQNDPIHHVPSDVVADEGDAANADPRLFREAFRAQHRLSVGVFERQNHYRISYSLRDVHRLTCLSEEERAAVRNEWRAWHRRHRRLGMTATLGWVAGAGLTWTLSFRGALVTNLIESALGLTVPILWLQVFGALAACALLVTLPGLLAAIAAPALCHAYTQGYADGVTRGVNRALRITPAIEREMWDELEQAERLDARLRQPLVTNDVPRRDASCVSTDPSTIR
jgi:hypothetical protein